MKLCVIGTGYVGLVGASVFSDWGNTVVGVDIDAKKIERIKAGDMPIYEPGLSELVLKNIKEKRLSFTTSLKEGIVDAEVVFICVGTPQDDTGAADLSAVWQVAEEIGKNLNGYKVIVTKSTVPVGTNERVKEIIKETSNGKVAFDVASNPEFLREGSSVEDMMKTDRTVMGSDSPKALEILKELYTHLNSPIVACDLRSAEIIKYASNAFLATKISFINEIALLCDRAGADVSVVAEGMGYDKRIGKAFLKAGIGYGGSCFPKDVAALFRTSTDQAYDFRLLRGVMEVNEKQKYHFVKKITEKLGKNLNGKVIACLGLAFKDNTDDIRESAAIDIVKALQKAGARVKVYDPEAMVNAKCVLHNKTVFCESVYAALENSQALIVATEWPIFAELNWAKVRLLMKKPLIIDGKNLIDSKAVEKLKFKYIRVGK